MEKLIQTAGWQAINRIGRLNEFYHILIENYKDMIEEIVRIEISNQPAIELFCSKDLTRYIFNFLSSASALIDSSRNTIKFYKNTSLEINYQKRKEELFVKNKQAVFIKNLRNYQVHFQIDFPMLSKTGKIIFDTFNLMQYKDWSSLSRKFIEENKEGIIIKPLFESYFKSLEAFYTPFYKELGNFHQEDLAERNKLAARFGIPKVEF